MGETLEALHRLQAVEMQLAAIRRKRETKARRVEVQKRRIRGVEEKLQGHRKAIRERQARVDALTLDVASREDGVARQREALNKARTNKEYSAILTVINTAKADNSKLESSILQLMERIQALNDEGASIESDRAKLLAEVETTQTALRAYEEQSREDFERLEASRDECTRSIAPTALALFTRVAERHDGEALVPIRKLHPKRDEYICTGCNMKITLEVVNALQTRDELQLCNVCGRVLCLESSLVR